MPTRRRFLAISAAALVGGAAAAATGASQAIWRGRVFGADARITLVGLTPLEARPHFHAVERILRRIERAASLFQPQSALARLNRIGHLAYPPDELLALCHTTDNIHAATGGAFDPTIQPLWALYAQSARERRAPTPQELAAAKALIGWQMVRHDPERITLPRVAMALSFNGIAQGHAADQVADLLRARGLGNVLVDMGEIAARGAHPGGGGWRAAIALPDGRQIKELRLRDRALATSSPAGTVLDPAGKIGHIMDPKTGLPAHRWRLASVSARSAAEADALSTAFCTMARPAIARALAQFPDATVEALI